MGTAERLQRLRHALAECEETDNLLIASAENRRYMSGFTGSAGALLITPDEQYIIVDSRYTQQAADQSPEFSRVDVTENLRETLGEFLCDLDPGAVGFEAGHTTYEEYSKMREEIAAVEWVPTEGIVEDLRQVKEAAEIQTIRAAAEIADASFQEILPSVAPGRVEEDIALDFEFCMRRRGAEGLAFPLIIASGVRSSMPHGQASGKEIEEGDFITFDYGSRRGGYCSDATRTVVVGEVDERQSEVYCVVQRAQRAAVEAIEPGKTGAEIDRVARDIIDDAGYGEYFGHGLGHGVGLAVHERPSLSRRRGTTPLEPGMVVTVEPGIYIPDWGGVRIEDLVVVTEDGSETLTGVDKELVVIDA